MAQTDKKIEESAKDLAEHLQNINDNDIQIACGVDECNIIVYSEKDIVGPCIYDYRQVIYKVTGKTTPASE